MSNLSDAVEEELGWDDDVGAEVDELCNCRFSLAYGGKILLNNAALRLIRGRRYGLCGGNGVGKSVRRLVWFGMVWFGALGGGDGGCSRALQNTPAPPTHPPPNTHETNPIHIHPNRR
jgi:hypothetical protein